MGSRLGLFDGELVGCYEKKTLALDFIEEDELYKV